MKIRLFRGPDKVRATTVTDKVRATTAMLLLCALTSPVFAAGRADVADAMMRGDQAALRSLVQQKADVNAAQIDGATALHWAVYHDDVAAARVLLRAGARVDAQNREGITP